MPDVMDAPTLLLKERLKTLEGDTPPDDFKHYFTKDDLDRNLLEGVAIQAICGFIKEGLATPDIDNPVCPKCKWLYDNVLPPGDDE